MSATEFLVDATTRHAVFLQRYAGGESKKAVKVLNRLRRDINARLMQEPTAFRAERLRVVLDDIDKIAAQGFSDISGVVKRGSIDIASSEVNFSAALYNKVSGVDFALPAEAALLQAVSEAPMPAPSGTGITIDDALRQFGEKKGTQIATAITDGVILGDTTPEIAAKVAEGMNTLQRRQLDTLVRTITNHTSSIARNEVYKANADLLDGYQWVATLDGRTTLICASRDGIVYQVGSGPLPPAHWGCRSTTIPTVKPAFSKAAGLGGRRASVGADGPKAVGSRTTYGGWLKRQPKAFVDEALGIERSRLFRSGKLTIDKFVDPTGRVFTLEQLEAQNPFVFLET